MARMQTIQQLGSSLHQRQKGFSLLEVLITLTISALALLGAADLQLRAMQTGQSSQARTQAVLLASDLVEKIEANTAYLEDYELQLTPPAISATALEKCFL